ncbi:hypothetical protein DSECCO2_583400 [anaerobic digester metagenome]
MTLIAAPAGEIVAGIDGNVPDLPGVPVHPEEETTVHHRTAADAGGEGDVDDVIGAAGGARPPLAEDAGPGVVDQGDREIEPLGKRAGDLHDREDDVRGVRDPSAAEVQGAGRRDADRRDFPPLRQGEEGLYPGDDRGGDHLPGGPRGRRWNGGMGQYGRVGAYQGRAEVGRAEVNGNHGRHQVAPLALLELRGLRA